MPMQDPGSQMPIQWLGPGTQLGGALGAHLGLFLFIWRPFGALFFVEAHLGVILFGALGPFGGTAVAYFGSFWLILPPSSS